MEDKKELGQGASSHRKSKNTPLNPPLPEGDKSGGEKWIRINAVKTRMFGKDMFKDDIIKKPTPTQLALARKDLQHRVCSIIEVKV